MRIDEGSPAPPATASDLLIRGGRVIDPSQGIDGPADLSIADGRIARMAAPSPDGTATAVYDATGKIVTPGLVDCHLHCYWGGTDEGIDPDSVCLRGGVTTVVDGGSAGSFTYMGMQRWIIEGSRSRVLAFVNLSRIGLTAAGIVPELFPPELADPEGTLKILRDYPDSAVGVKIRLSRDAVGGPCSEYLKMGRQVADASGTRLMLHIGNSVETLPQILDQLRPGDIITHCFSPMSHGILNENGGLLPEVRDAAEAGIVFDCAHGRRHFSLEVARRAMDQGFLPTTISTDLATVSINGPAFSLLTTMDKFLSLGVPLSQVIARVTSAPATVLNRGEEFGTLRPGCQADVTILDYEEGDFTLVDSRGETRQIQRRLRAVAVVQGGTLITGVTR